MDDQCIEEINEKVPESEIPVYYGAPAERQPPNNMATASMVMGILALVTCCCYYTAPVFGGLGILFALLSRPEGHFEGQAKAGLIMSVIAVVLMGLLYTVLIMSLTAQMSMPPVRNLPVIPSAPDVTEGMDNLLTVFFRLPMGGGMR